MSTIAITDPISSASLLARRARDLGHEVVEVRTFDKNSEYYTRAYDPTVPSRTVEYRGDDASTLHALRDVDRLVVGADSGVAITERLQLFRGELRNEPGLILARADKVEQAKAIERAGLPVVPQAYFSQDQEAAALAFARHLRFPVVLKPRASGGTNNVRLAADESAFLKWFRAISRAKSLYDRLNGGCIVMEYVNPQHAREFVVDMVAFDGEHLVTDVWEYEKEPLNETPAMYRSMRLIAAEQASDLIIYTKAVARVLGHRAGAVHAEIWDIGGEMRLVEVGFRLPGLITKISADATGRDQVRWTLDSALEQPAPELARDGHQRHAAVVFIAASDGGNLARDLPDLTRLTSFHSSGLKATRAGDVFERTVDVGTIAGWVGLVNTDPEAIQHDIERIREIERLAFRAS